MGASQSSGKHCKSKRKDIGTFDSVSNHCHATDEPADCHTTDESADCTASDESADCHTSHDCHSTTLEYNKQLKVLLDKKDKDFERTSETLNLVVVQLNERQLRITELEKELKKERKARQEAEDMAEEAMEDAEKAKSKLKEALTAVEHRNQKFKDMLEGYQSDESAVCGVPALNSSRPSQAVGASGQIFSSLFKGVESPDAQRALAKKEIEVVQAKLSITLAKCDCAISDRNEANSRCQAMVQEYNGMTTQLVNLQTKFNNLIDKD